MCCMAGDDPLHEFLPQVALTVAHRKDLGDLGEW